MNDDLNLAKKLPADVLSSLSYYLKKVIDEDKESRKQWLDEIEDIKPYLGFSFENIANKDINQLVSDIVKYNFQTYDSTLATCVLKLWCLIRGQILPRTGPVGADFDVNNSEDYVTKANFVKDILNEFLTTEDIGFYPDYDKFLFYLVFYGCITRKIYFDPFLKRPVTRFIKPEDFLIDNDSSSIEESNRLTHVLHLSKREIILAQTSGRFTDPELTYINASKDDLINGSDDAKDADVDLSVYSDKSNFDFYETHVYLDLKSFFKNEIATGTLSLNELPLPYIVTMCVDTNKIVSILPNWNEEDEEKKRINCFVHYSLFPNFSLYSLGLAKLLGGNAIAQTKILRMIIDAGIHQNFPGGVYASGAENLNNNLNIIPGSFIPLDNSLHSIADSIMPFPFQGASPVMLEISQMLTTQMQQLSGTTEITADNDMNNAPVGTTLAALEVNHRLQSTVLQTIHKSFSEEIRLLYKHFNFPIDYYDIVEPKNISLTSEPSIESTTQRIIKAETVIKLAESAPQMHNMYNVLKNMYEALGVQDIDNILIDPATQPPELPPEEMNEGMSPAQLQMADIQQRMAEVEAKERIETMKLEGDGYKTQLQLELQRKKIAHEIENTRLKRDFELEKIQLQEKELEWRKQIETLEIQQRQEKSELLERLADLELENETLKNGLINA